MPAGTGKGFGEGESRNKAKYGVVGRKQTVAYGAVFRR